MTPTPLLASLALAALAPSTPPCLQEQADDPVEPPVFAPADVFELEFADDPQLSPAGDRVVFVRRSMDVMSDRLRSSLWLVDLADDRLRPLVASGSDARSPRWSPSGDRLAYIALGEDGSEIWVRYMDTGQTALISRLASSPSGLAWSPDGARIAFVMHVREATEPMVKMPPKPEGAEWAEPANVIETLNYRSDGSGYLEAGWRQLFVLPAVGGTPRQLTRGPHHAGSPAWVPDGSALVFSSNRREDAVREPQDSELYELDLATGDLRALTDRFGPDGSPAVSPDGELVAFVGFDDQRRGYQPDNLYVLERSTGSVRQLADRLDRGLRAPRWAPDGRAVFCLFDSEGSTRLARVPLEGTPEVLADDVGGTTLGRPYASGSFSVAPGRVVYTGCSAERPADLMLGEGAGFDVRRLTDLNGDLLEHRRLGRVEELNVASSVDGRNVQAWLVAPPDLEPGSSHPLLLEIHGGPFANYGPRFSAELQLYAAAGYLVLYVNPRGSTGYGREFGDLIHHAYPGDDYHDLMSAVDAVIARGQVDPERLFVTGGSGGGVLTAWIVGTTDRFAAAVVAKPVIHWTSFVLTADMYAFFWRYWFPGYPWEHQQHYWERSPLSRVGQIETPTMLLTGEQDYRTPISESEQLYQALQLRGIETAMVRIPGAGHGIASRPSRLVSKVLHVLAWFERHDPGR